MKNGYRMISMLLVLSFLLALVPAPAYAAVGPQVPDRVPDQVSRLEIDTIVNPLYADVYTPVIPERPTGAAPLSTDPSDYLADFEEAAAVLRQGMINRQTEIVVRYRTTETDLGKVYSQLLDAAFVHTGEPEAGDYLYRQWGGCGGSVSYGTMDGEIYAAFTYQMVYFTTLEQETAVDTAVAELLDSLELTGKTDYEKYMAVYQWMCGNIVYDYDNLEDDAYTLKYTGYAALMDRTAVCQGYAVLLYRLMLELGIDCRIVTGIGNGGPHAWNIVELEGLYYNCDATWDSNYGADVERYRYSLRCPDNFTDHARDAEFDSADFHADYPMGNADYTPPEVTVIASGTCGENLTWTLDSNGTLTISGTGKMKSFWYEEEVRWGERNDEIIKVVIEAGVTSIGAFAFYGCSNLTEITIPDSVTSIGGYAFWGCSKLTSVDIPDGVISIWEAAFWNCSSLTSVTIGSGVSSMDPFYGCTSLTELIVDAANESYYTIDSVLFSKTDHTLLYCPEGKTGNYSIPASVTSIGESAFLNCSSLTGITIPASVTSIGESAFRGCTSLTELIVDAANESYSSTDSVLFSKTDKTLIFCPACKTGNYSIPEGVTGIGAGAFYECGGLTCITIPEGVTSIGNNAFFGCTSLIDITIPASVTSIGNGVFRDCDGLTSIIIPASVTSIGDNAFFGCTSLVNITIPDGVTSIGLYAFSDCSSLTNITIPDKVTSIAQGTFHDCSSLTSITIPASVTHISYYVFQNCSSLTEITFEGDAPRFIASEVFGSVVANVYYPADNATWTADVMQDYGGTLTWIPNYPDHNYDSVVTAPTCTEQGYTTHTCTICGDSYVDSYVSATGHSYGDWVVTTAPTCTVKGVETHTCHCGATETQEVDALGHDLIHHEGKEPTSTEAGWAAYETCSRCDYSTYQELPATGLDDSIVASGTCGKNLTWTLDDQGTLTISGTGAMTASPWRKYGNNIVNVVIHDGVTSIGQMAFDGCSSLTSIIIPDSVTSIDGYAFWNCSSLMSIAIPDSVTSIGSGAFWYCHSLTSVTIGSGVASIGSYPFGDCSSLTELVVDAANESYYSVDSVLFSKTDHALISYPGGKTGAYSIPDDVTSIAYAAFSGCVNLTSITIPSSVTSIPESAFGGCTSLTRVIIGTGVTSIGEYAFSDCNSLTSIIFLGNVPSPLGDTAFEGVTANGYYPADNSQWTWWVERYYDRKITWIPYRMTEDNHAVITVAEAVEPTCTESGWTESTFCILCDSMITEQVVVPALGHNYQSVVTVPTCTEQGYTTYTCTVCGHSYVDDYVDATGHSFGNWVETKAPTCTEKGSERRDCANCDHYETRDVAATGHSHTAVVIKPTCTEQGYTTHTCGCGDSYVDSYVPATGHSFGNWVETKAPTCTEKGQERRDCANCDHYETRDVAATGHSHTAVATKPTCTTQGYTTYTCHCGDSYVDDYVDATGHHYEGGFCTECGAEEVRYVLGDVNGDGRINVLDAGLIVSYYTGVKALDETQQLAADVNGDGRINVLDAGLIVSFYTGVITSFPAEQ